MSNNTVSARMSEKDIVLLRKVCRARGEDLSDFLRRSIRKELASLSFLSAEDSQALGVKTENPSQAERV